jgi:hypothetical protein
MNLTLDREVLERSIHDVHDVNSQIDPIYLNWVINFFKKKFLFCFFFL